MGEGCSVVLSGVERSRLAAGAAGGETGRSSRIIGPAGGVSSATSFPCGLKVTSRGFDRKFVAQGFSCADFRSFYSIFDPEGPDVPEGTPDPGANRLELAGSSMCNRIFLRHLEGPGIPSDWSYIDN